MLSPAISSVSFNDCERGFLNNLNESNEIVKYDLMVKGMTCAACVCAIECTLKSNIDPLILKSVKIDLLLQTVTVELVASSVKLDSIISLIRQAGFTVVGSSSDWRCKLETRKLSELRSFSEMKFKFIKILFFSLPVIIFMHKSWILSLAFSIPLHFYAAFDVYKTALNGFNMERLIAINCIASLLYSVILKEQHAMYDCAAYVLILFTGGKLIECVLKRRITASSDGSDLLIQLPKIVKSNGVEVAVKDLTVGHVIDLNPGVIIPFDGEIVECKGLFVNESTLTGEPLPKRKQVNDNVLAGTRIENGTAVMKIIRKFENSFINKLARGVYEPLVNDLKDNESVRTLVDEIVKWFIPIILLISAFTFIIWIFIFLASEAMPRDLIPEWRNVKRFPSTPLAASIYFSLTVLCVACPCALAIATPVAVLIAKAVGIRRGFLIRDPRAFIEAPGIDVLLFDKTGTLTEGRPKMECECFEGFEGDWMFEAIRLVESKVLEEQEHPIAKAINQYCKTKTHYKPLNLKVKDIIVIPGQGVKSTIIRDEVEEHVIEIMKSSSLNELNSTSDVLFNNLIVARFYWFDELKPEALDMIYFFKTKFRLGIVSGDSQASTERTASFFLPGTFTYVFGDCRPEDKGRIVEDLKGQGKRVAFCGDGLNDSMAMTRSDLSISLDPTASFASVCLIRKHLNTLVKVFQGSRTLNRQIWLNMAWAIIYNMISIPVAMGALILIGLPPIGPEIGTALMSFSGITILFTSIIFQ